MKFWDSSAILPLLVNETTTSIMLGLLRSTQAMSVWWGTTVECVSALARLEREHNLSTRNMRLALQRMDELGIFWHEVAPTERVRQTSTRLLRTYNLRAADALQLAAAIVAAEQIPSSLDFICLDQRLIAAADREGFRILPRNL